MKILKNNPFGDFKYYPFGCGRVILMWLNLESFPFFLDFFFQTKLNVSQCAA